VRENRFLAIAGAAGSGKTTILHQLAHDLVQKNGVPPTNIMYLPLGDPRFQTGNDVISDAIQEFATYFWKNSEDTEGYVFIDDADANDTWAQQVQNSLDEFTNLTVTVTLPTLKRADLDKLVNSPFESVTDLLLPAKFFDVVSDPLNIEIDRKQRVACRNSLSDAAQTGNIPPLIGKLEKIKETTSPITSDLKRSIISFFGGESRDPDPEDVNRNLELTIYRDVPRYQQFEQRSDLHALCAIAAMRPGETFSLKRLSEVLNCDRRTLQRYIDILQDFFVLTPSYQYEFERRRSVRLYIRDPILVSALTDIEISGFPKQEVEKRLSTTVVFDHLKRLSFHYHKTDRPVHFWESGGDAVDFVVLGENDVPIPIATNAADNYQQKMKGLREFQSESESEIGVIVGRDLELTVEDDIIIIPLWLFLFVI
jgi:predicted AAA+ superfamily ATPase